MSRFAKVWILAFYLALNLLFYSNSIISISAQQSGEVYIYGFHDSPSLQTLVKYFNNTSDWNVTVYDLYNLSYSTRFLKIVKTLNVAGIKVLPPDLCITCIQDLTEDDIFKVYSSPLAGIFRNGKLVVIIIGVVDYNVLNQALAVDDENVNIFTRYEDVQSLRDEGIRTRLEEIFVGYLGIETNVSALNLVPSIIFLALADSVNPCTFAVFTALLFNALLFGKIKAVTRGLSFILGIFVGYYALGLGLFQIFARIPYFHNAFILLGLAIGLLNVRSGLKPTSKSLVPKSVRNIVEHRIIKSSTSATASVVLGLFAAFTLLPCSGGPYLVGLSLISALKEWVQAHLLLILYNSIFIMPLILILAAISVSTRLPRKIKIFRSTNLRLMKLLNGTFLAALCIYLLLTLNF